ncbi:MAG TPA: ABC transporter permease [Gaiellaceae bacterium]|jgi:ABC-2 type transport system permease protein
MKLFLHQLRNEQLLFWRSREAAVFVFLFPVLLFLLLGTVYDGTYHGHPLADYLVAGLLGYGAANTAFGGLAITLVLRREQGVLKRIRATPLPSAVYLAGVLASILGVFAIQAVLLVFLGRVVFDAELPQRSFSLAATLGVGALSFAALGVALSTLIRSAEGASAVVNVVILPMTFLSGGFGPTRSYPRILRALSEALPLKHLIDAVAGIYLDHEPVWEQRWALLVVLGWGVIGLVVAFRAFRWEPREG